MIKDTRNKSMSKTKNNDSVIIKNKVEHQNRTPNKTLKKKSLFERWQFWTVAGCLLIAIVTALALIIINENRPELNSADLIKKYAESSPYVKNIIESDNPDDIMGDENQYISKSSWEDSRISDIREDHAGTIEVFRNEKDAELREWHINQTTDKCDEYFSASKYGKENYDIICGNIKYGTTYRIKTAVIRLSASFSDSQISEYKNYFDDVIDDFKIKETDIPSEDKINDIKAEKIEQMNQTYSALEKELKVGLDEIASELDESINSAMSSMDESELERIKTDINDLKSIPYYSENIKVWENKVNDISEKVSKKKADDEKAKKAAMTRKFSAGKYIVGKNIDSGTFNVSAISGSGNFIVYDESGMPVINEIMSSSDRKYYIKSYSNADLELGYKIEIAGSLTLKFVVSD